MTYQYHSDAEFKELETRYSSNMEDARATIADLRAELAELTNVAHAALDTRDDLRIKLDELIAAREQAFQELQSCEHSYYGAVEDLGRAWEVAKVWKAEAKRLWGKLHYHQDKVPSPAERTAMPPLCDYCHSRHFGYQDHDMA